MNNLIMYLIMFAIVYIMYLIFVIRKEQSIEKYKDSMEVKYLINVYKLNIGKHNFKKLAHNIILVNSFIIATTTTALMLIDNIFLLLVIGVLTLIPFQLTMYHILGSFYKKKEGKNNV